jgi:hypothetical protein|tara:strand:- start:2 stop:214 length:213 start_codon:yes stop_codon:yes gene_type:complete
MDNLITITLPTVKVINGVSFDVESPFLLNLTTNGDKVDVHFWKPSIKANGKLFVRIAKSDQAKFIKACKG